jgi:molecular chaperone Hsp33
MLAMNESPLGLVRHTDLIQPFMLHNSVMRGRMVRLDESLNAILSRHDYPAIVSHHLSEMLVLGGMLSSNLPEGGILTLQVKGDGNVPMMVVDVQQDGSLRGYAQMVEIPSFPVNASLVEVFGKGYLAITLDTTHGEPYQGIVPLEGESLSDAVTHYFTQSQQLDVLLHTSVTKRTTEENGVHWSAAGIMLERMPELSFQEQSSAVAPISDTHNWEYQSLLVKTTREGELADPYLAPSALLYRLFNEGGVWVYETKLLHDQCRCSRDRITHVLLGMGEAAVQEMCVDGVIFVTCQFCSRDEVFTPEELTKSMR